MKAAIWIMRALFLLTCLAIAFLPALAQEPVWADGKDNMGRAYPIECQRDLGMTGGPVVFVRSQDLQKVARAVGLPELSPGLRYRGLYLYGVYPHIYVDKWLTGRLLEDVVHHERCHHVTGHWHD